MLPKQPPPPPSPISSYPRPIIYQNNKPNFEPSSDRDFLRRMVELDIGLHLLIFVVFAVVSAVIFLSNKSQIPLPQVPASGQNRPTAETPAPIAQAGKKPIYIDSQVMSIDKAFNSQPQQIKLTLNGALKKEVLGFLPYWVVDKAGEIDTRRLTAISFFGLEVGPDGEIIKTSATDNQMAAAWDIWQGNPNLISFIRKARAQRIKFYLTLKSFSNDNIEKLVRSPEAQQRFIRNALYQVSSKGLDGINVDFEYIGTPPDDVRDEFSLLISNLNKELKRQYPKSVLTVDTYPRSATVLEFFDPQLLASQSDGLVVMGYDFHTPQSGTAGAVAPMGGEGDNLFNNISAYLEKVDPAKIILAVPYYGYDWPTTSKSANAPVASGDVKVLTYAEIVDATKKISIGWDDTTQTPWYAYFDSRTGQNRVVHFENTRSLAIKYDFVNRKNLAGVGIWALGLDGRNTDLEQLLSDKFAY